MDHEPPAMLAQHKHSICTNEKLLQKIALSKAPKQTDNHIYEAQCHHLPYFLPILWFVMA